MKHPKGATLVKASTDQKAVANPVGGTFIADAHGVRKFMAKNHRQLVVVQLRSAVRIDRNGEALGYSAAAGFTLHRARTGILSAQLRVGGDDALVQPVKAFLRFDGG